MIGRSRDTDHRREAAARAEVLGWEVVADDALAGRRFPVHLASDHLEAQRCVQAVLGPGSCFVAEWWAGVLRDVPRRLEKPQPVQHLVRSPTIETGDLALVWLRRSRSAALDPHRFRGRLLRTDELCVAGDEQAWVCHEALLRPFLDQLRPDVWLVVADGEATLTHLGEPDAATFLHQVELLHGVAQTLADRGVPA